MTLNVENITVLAGGIGSPGWKRVQVRGSMKDATRQFGLEVTEVSSALFSTFAYPPGTPIVILANADLMVNGFVNRYQPTIDAKMHSVQLQGRSRSQDFVDSSATHKTGYFEKKTPLEIAQELDLYGTGVSAEVPLEKLDYFQLYQGESNHAAVERALKDQFASQVGQADGSIKITNAKAAKRHAGALIEGHNILKASGVLSDDRRFSETTVKGQRRHGTTAQDLRVKERFKDYGVRRYRPKLLIHETDTNSARAKRRAQHEGERGQGFSVACTIITQGWRDDLGVIWQPNYLVYVQSPALKIMGDMLIETCTWTQDGSGSITELRLVDPKAYQGTAGKANKTDPSWGGDMTGTGE